jgi:hypothetical protein
MGAARFAAAVAAREQVDPGYRERRTAQREFGRRIWQLEVKYREQIQTLQHALAATQTELTQVQVSNSRLTRQLRASDDRFREELGIVHAALNKAESDNAQLRQNLKRVEPLTRLLTAAIQQDSEH